MTDPTGKVFLSYKHEKKELADLLEEVLREHGVPVWRDVSGMRSKSLEGQLQEVLADPGIASGIVLVSEGVTESEIIRKVELPAFADRVDGDDPFFVVIVPCPDITYDDAKEILAEAASLSDFTDWYKETLDEPTYDAARGVVQHVLTQRLEAIHAELPSGEPIECSLDTHDPPAYATDPAVMIDWFAHFTDGLPSATVWEDRLLPTVTAVIDHINQYAPERPLRFRGHPHLPAAFALGQCLEPPRGIHATWLQQNDNGTTTEWTHTTEVEDSRLTVEPDERTVSSSELAVMVNISRNVESAVVNTKSDLPAFNAELRLTPEDGPDTHLTAGQAVDAARLFRTAVDDIIDNRPEIATIHLFMAVPAGLAFLFGQQTNTLRPIQTYVHLEDEGRYEQAALLRDRQANSDSQHPTADMPSPLHHIWKTITSVYRKKF